MAVRGRDDQRHPRRFGKKISCLLGEAGQIAVLEEARTRERRRQQEMRIDLARHCVGQGVSVANQHFPRGFTIAVSDPSDHDQGEHDQRQNDGQRQHAQTPAQRTGLDHRAGPVSLIPQKGACVLVRPAFQAPRASARRRHPPSSRNIEPVDPTLAPDEVRQPRQRRARSVIAGGKGLRQRHSGLATALARGAGGAVPVHTRSLS